MNSDHPTAGDYAYEIAARNQDRTTDLYELVHLLTLRIERLEAAAGIEPLSEHLDDAEEPVRAPQSRWAMSKRVVDELLATEPVSTTPEVSFEKCARHGCGEPRMYGSIWCGEGGCWSVPG